MRQSSFAVGEPLRGHNLPKKNMPKDPAFLFYSQDFFTGVSTMTFEDRGKYITLLCLMHQHGRMSEESIRFLVGNISVTLKAKFDVDEKGLWYNKRLEIEAEKRNNFTNSRRENGKLGGRGNKADRGSPDKNNLNKSKPKAKKKHMGNHMGNENVDENKIKITDENLIYPYTGEEFLKTWHTLRREPKWINKSFAALQSSLIKLSNFPEPEAIKLMLNAIEGGWQGIWGLHNGNSNGNRNSKNRTNRDDLTDYAQGNG